MEVAVLPPRIDVDFDFNGERSSSSCLSVPTTPRGFGNYFYSTPSSPVRMSEFYRDFNESPTSNNDFAFDICKQLETVTLSADELFDDGKIRPLETPPRSPISKERKTIQNAYSSESKIPSETIIENAERSNEQKRGRRRKNNPAVLSSSSRRTARSLSPERVSNNTQQLTLIAESPFAAAASSKSSKRWRLKDLLFRSASEGRGTEKESLKKYSTSYKKQEELKNASFKSSHELHYTMNRAASGDRKKTTFLPYRKGILGGLLFNPKVHAYTSFRSSR